MESMPMAASDPKHTRPALPAAEQLHPAAQPAGSLLQGQVSTKALTCDKHGEVEVRGIFAAGKMRWHRCPKCVEDERQAQELAAQAKRQAEAEREHAKMLANAAIPERFIGRTLDTFKAGEEGQQRAVGIVRQYIETFQREALKTGSSLIFAGPPGTGKSHLAAAILQGVLSPRVRYMTCMDMIRAVRETWRRDSEVSESKMLRYLETLDLLVIDEIGVQYGTEGEQTILFDVLDRRYRAMKPVVLLTNQDKAGFRAYVGDRVFDRLTETGRWVPFAWESYRRTAREESGK